MKCQILFSGKNKKNNIILSSAENAQRVVKVKDSLEQIIYFKPFMPSGICYLNSWDKSFPKSRGVVFFVSLLLFPVCNRTSVFLDQKPRSVA